MQNEKVLTAPNYTLVICEGVIVDILDFRLSSGMPNLIPIMSPLHLKAAIKDNPPVLILKSALKRKDWGELVDILRDNNFQWMLTE